MNTTDDLDLDAALGAGTTKAGDCGCGGGASLADAGDGGIPDVEVLQQLLDGGGLAAADGLSDLELDVLDAALDLAPDGELESADDDGPTLADLVRLAERN